MPYKNPPKSSRFKAGRSGNPLGRTGVIDQKEIVRFLQTLNKIIHMAAQQLNTVNNSKETK